MILQTIDNRYFKYIFGIVIALPFSLAILILTFPNLMAAIGYFQKLSSKPFEFEPIILLAANLCGLLGLIGAWMRLINYKDKITDHQRKKIKLLLAFSFLAVGLLAINPLNILLIFHPNLVFAYFGLLVLLSGGMSFYVST